LGGRRKAIILDAALLDNNNKHTGNNCLILSLVLRYEL